MIATKQWEDVIERFIDGTVSRFEAERCRMWLHLTPAARGEIESTLRMADDLASLRTNAAVPEGAAGQMTARLAAAPPPTTLPNWTRVGDGYEPAAPLRASDEELVNQVIEGTAPTDLTSSGLGADAAREIGEVRGLADVLGGSGQVTAPAAAADRLRAAFRAFAATEAGEVDPQTAKRLLGREVTKSQPKRDLLAAGKDAEDEGDEPQD